MSSTAERITKIKNELDERRHSWLMLPCLSEKEVTKFEQSFGVALPDEYRCFLMMIGNGGPGPFYGLYPLDVAISSDPLPYMRNSENNELGQKLPPKILQTEFPSDDDFESVREKIAFGAAPGTLALAHYGCGTIERLVISGKAAGSMWFDVSFDGRGIHDRGETFLDWYENWLAGKHPTMWNLNDFMIKEFRSNNWHS
jgi:SMI1 / KNR4 family (SUKH-1)